MWASWFLIIWISNGSVGQSSAAIAIVPERYNTEAHCLAAARSIIAQDKDLRAGCVKGN